MSKLKRLVFDLDGCFFSFNNGYARLLYEENPDKIPKDWQESDTTPSIWDWDRARGFTSEELARVWGRITKKDSTFWSKLEPLPGAVETVKRLNQLTRKDVEVLFLSNRFGYNTKRQSEIALYELGMNYPTVLIAPSGEAKIPTLRALGADYFLDDRLDTLNEAVTVAASAGYNWKIHLHLLNKPYNQTGRLGGYTVVDSLQDSLERVELWS